MLSKVSGSLTKQRDSVLCSINKDTDTRVNGEMICRTEWEWKRGYSMAQSLSETLGMARNTDTVVSSGKMVAFMRAVLKKAFTKGKAHTTMQTFKKPMLDNLDEDRWKDMVPKHLRMADSLQGHLRMDKSTERGL